jgi:4-amino-4-deoxy-L-arabinose transferase-like glycosyltransferase
MIVKNKDFLLRFLPIATLLILSFFSRILIAYNFGDQHIENEWKIITDNLINHKEFSFFKAEDGFLPCVYMPPMYPFFLFFINIISFSKFNFVDLIIFIQIFLSTYSVYLFYTINNEFFSEKIAFINSIIFSFLPLNLYAASQISSASLQLFISLLFLKYFINLSDNQSKKNITIFSIVSGILILTRGEFILIFIISIFYMFYFKKIKIFNLLTIILISSLIVTPYLIRNYVIFKEIVIVKSLGFNLWKGNNQYSTVEGVGISPPVSFDESWSKFNKPEFKEFKTKLENLKNDDLYEIKRDNIFLVEGINNITQDSYRYINLFFKKMFSYFFINLNSDYPNYYNIFYLFPTLILSLISFPGIFIAIKKKKYKTNYLLIHLSLNLFIFSIFFILPRYKLTIIPIQIILGAYFLNFIYDKYFNNKKIT